MKTKKKLAIFIAVALILQIIPLPEGSLAEVSGIFKTSSAEETQAMSGTIGGGSIKWELTEDTTTNWSSNDTPYKLTLSGSGDMEPFEIITYIDADKGIKEARTSAPWKAFTTQIKTISIGDGITNISDYALYRCTNAKYIEIPDTVTKIGKYAFYLCESALDISMSNTVTEIGEYAFYSCSSIRNIDLPDTLTEIAEYAFEYCRLLENIIIPNNITNIKKSTFAGCAYVKSITIPDSVTSIGDGAFAGCRVYLESVTIPSSVTSIGDYAFNQCENLKTVNISEGVTSIGKNAFAYSSLTGFTIPASVTSIGANPFLYNKSLSEIKVAEGNKNYKTENDMLIELKDSKPYKVIFYPYTGNVDVIVPANVQIIGADAFRGDPIQSLSLPGSLKEIQEGAFTQTELTSVSIPGNVETIGKIAFASCSALKDVSLGGGLITLGDSAFNRCRLITGIRLPDKINTIGKNVFEGCTNLKEMSFPNSITSLGDGVLKGCTNLEKVSFGSEIETITGGVFEKCTNLTEITISKNNMHMIVEDNVVYNKEKSKLIYYITGQAREKFCIPESITTIGIKAFTDCEHLEELRFPASVTTLEEYAIHHNTSITKLLFYGNAPSITEHGWTDGGLKRFIAQNNSLYENGTKHNNSGLTIFKTEESQGWENGWTGTEKYKTEEEQNPDKYEWKQNYEILVWNPANTDIINGDFGNGLKWEYRDDIGEIKFTGDGEVPDFDITSLPTWSTDENKNHMQDIQLIETGGAARIGNNAFNGASKLLKVISGDTLKAVGNGTFANCTSLKIVSIPGVETIGNEAFMGNTALEEDIDIRGAKDIGQCAFTGCTYMRDILLGENLENIGKEAFSLCISLDSFIIPESVVSLGDGCFNGCSSIRTINIPKMVNSIPENCFAGCSNFQKIYFYGDWTDNLAENCFTGTHSGLTIYYRAGNPTWDVLGNEWNGIPVMALDKFYTEQKDHYSFKNSLSSFGYSSNYVIPRQRFVTTLQSIIRGSYYYSWDYYWGGNCFGMAASTAEFYEGNNFNVNDYTETAQSLYDVLAPRRPDTALTKLIEIYQVSQYVDEIGTEIAENYGKYRRLIKQVEEFERSGGLNIDSVADPVIICVYSNYGGHAVVPVSVNMDKEGNYILEVYDSNNPDGFKTLIIKKDFSGIEYGKYTKASFVKYSTIRDTLVNVDFTGQSMAKSPTESDKIGIAINREKVSVKNGGGRDYTEIEGAYEQIPVSGIENDTFTGIRSFVLPQKGINEYKVEVTGSGNNIEEEKPLKYYVSTEDLFAEIETSDNNAKLTVNSVEGTGEDIIKLTSGSTDTKTNITVMDISGIEKELSVKSSEVIITMIDDSEMKITATEGSQVIVNNNEVDLSDGKEVHVSFYAAENENPLKASDLSCELSLDNDNKASGTIEAYLTWAKEEAGTVDITAKLKDESGNIITECNNSQNASLGMQIINFKIDNIESSKLNELLKGAKAVCEMTITDSEGNHADILLDGIVLKVNGEEVVVPSPTETPKPSETKTPAPTKTPATEPSETKTPDTGFIQYPVTPTPSATTPAATATPTANPSSSGTGGAGGAGASGTAVPVPTVTPIPTEPGPAQTPVVTQEPEITPEPYGTQDTDTKSSLPEKGKIKTIGSLKYIVVKPAKKNGTVAVYGLNKKNTTKVVIPKKVKINGYSFKVTAINKKAFANMPKLSQVTLGANITKIGNSAFEKCKKLQFVIISKNVTSIGKKAFAGCKKLDCLLVKSNKIKSVASKAFNGVPSDIKVKTSKKKWKKYSKMFVKKGKMPRSALFIVNPVKLEYNNKKY